MRCSAGLENRWKFQRFRRFQPRAVVDNYDFAREMKKLLEGVEQRRGRENL